ncbi:MAG: tetratricopeptide repeat protein [Acidobacteriota bacterium]
MKLSGILRRPILPGPGMISRPRAARKARFPHLRRALLCLLMVPVLPWPFLVAGSPAQSSNAALQLVRQGRWVEAEKAFAALESSGRLTPSLFEKAVEVSTHLNHWGRVAQLLENLRRRQPLALGQRVALYEAYLKSDRKAEAERELVGLWRERPDDQRITHLLAFLFLSQNRFAEAASTYQRFLEIHPDSIESRVNLALVRFKQQRGPQALDQLKKAFRLSSRQANLYFYRQLARTMPPEGLAQLVEDVKREIGVPSDGAGTDRYLAREYENLGRYDPAIHFYERYLARVGEDDETRLALAKLYFHVGQDDRSAARLEPLLERPGEKGDQSRLLGAELAVRSGDFERGERLLQQLPASFAQLAVYQFFSARIAIHQGDDQKAEVLLRKAISKDPDLVQAYFHLGQLYLRNGQFEKGRQALADYQRLKR